MESAPCGRLIYYLTLYNAAKTVFDFVNWGAQKVGPLMTRECGKQLALYQKGTAPLLSSLYSGGAAALKYGWTHLTPNIGWGMGTIGLLGLSYLVYQYWQKRNGQIVNTNTNQNTIHLHLQMAPGMKMVEENKGGQVIYTVQKEGNDPVLGLLKELLEETRAQRKIAVTT